MAESNATQTPLEAFSETYDVLIHGIKATSDRAHRLSTALIEDAQQGQRERLQMAKTWAERPLDLASFSSSLVETVTRSQGRSFEFASRWVGELAEAQREFGDGLRRVLTANRSVATATAGAARDLVNRAREGPQSTRPSVTPGGARAATRERTEIPEKRPSDGETASAI